MSIGEFWNSSLPDIQDTIKSYTRKKKDKIMQSFMHAEIIANRLAKLLPSDDDVPQLMPWDYYPGLFADEKILHQKQKQEQELEKFKTMRRNAMDEYNARFYGGGENE